MPLTRSSKCPNSRVPGAPGLDFETWGFSTVRCIGCPIHDAVSSRHGWGFLLLFVIPEGNLLLFVIPHPERSEGGGICFEGAGLQSRRKCRMIDGALAPEGICDGCPIHDAVSSRHGWGSFFCLSFPKGICFFVCHSRRESALKGRDFSPAVNAGRLMGLQPHE